MSDLDNRLINEARQGRVPSNKSIKDRLVKDLSNMGLKGKAGERKYLKQVMKNAPNLPKYARASVAGIDIMGDTFDEGEKEQKLQKFRVRNKAVIEQAKKLNRANHGGKLTCVNCNLQPETKYYREGQVLSPEQTNALIEGHHIKGLEEGEVTVNDIECLCGNCHRYKHI